MISKNVIEQWEIERCLSLLRRSCVGLEDLTSFCSARCSVLLINSILVHSLKFYMGISILRMEEEEEALGGGEEEKFIWKLAREEEEEEEEEEYLIWILGRVSRGRGDSGELFIIP